MAVFAQISDLHFGRAIKEIETALIDDLNSQNLDLVIISGDFTQRATASEFSQAKKFLEQLTAPVLSLPGNHDVPLYALHERLFDPYGRYKKFITQNLNPRFDSKELTVVGLNTSHGLTFASGKTPDALAASIQHLKAQDTNKLKVLVAHHPIDPWPLLDSGVDIPIKDRIFSTELRAAPVDLIMTGHNHHSRVLLTPALYKDPDSHFIISMAGTTLSSRTRGEENSYHLFHFDSPNLNVEIKLWDWPKHKFVTSLAQPFRKNELGWSPQDVFSI